MSNKSRLEKMRELARGLREENLDEITMSVGVGGYTNAAQPPGAADGYNPPITKDILRRKSLGRWAQSLKKTKKKGES